jgi:uncharacterized protein
MTSVAPGGLGGKYTLDFSLLANEAMKLWRRCARPNRWQVRAGLIGYPGTSEGGWVAPMAATRAPVDFVIGGSLSLFDSGACLLFI